MILTVLTPAEKLAALEWPELEVVERISLLPDDWLVVCAGFEDRARAVLENVVVSGGRCRVLLILYRPFIDENKEHEYFKICHEAGIEPAKIIYNCQEPAGFGGHFLEELVSNQGRIFVDVSGMSRLLITQTLGALGTRARGFADSFVTYAEAEFYYPGHADAEAEFAKGAFDPTFPIQFLSSGVFEVTVVPELSALALAGAQTRLIAFPSLDEHQLIALQSELQPSRFSFIEGVPPSPENLWREEFIAKVNHLEDIRASAGERFKVSTLDYRETLSCLLQLYARHAIRERLLLAPTGSKMQTVAVGIFRAFVRDVQIVYPTPQGFRSPDDYTHGVRTLHQLPLERFVLPED
ncbi:MAG TPA: hypothetical protein VGM86_18460 [Thermoanaerobaculia bacterium]|jgi:hypothetical protein